MIKKKQTCRQWRDRANVTDEVIAGQNYLLRSENGVIQAAKMIVSSAKDLFEIPTEFAEQVLETLRRIKPTPDEVKDGSHASCIKFMEGAVKVKLLLDAEFGDIEIPLKEEK